VLEVHTQRWKAYEPPQEVWLGLIKCCKCKRHVVYNTTKSDNLYLSSNSNSVYVKYLSVTHKRISSLKEGDLTRFFFFKKKRILLAFLSKRENDGE
jgi:hypothetical protein